MVNTSFIVIDGERNGLLAWAGLCAHTHRQSSCLITHIVYISIGFSSRRAAEMCRTCFITLSHFDGCVGAVCIQQLPAVIRLFHFIWTFNLQRNWKQSTLHLFVISHVEKTGVFLFLFCFFSAMVQAHNLLPPPPHCKIMYRACKHSKLELYGFLANEPV